MEYSSQSLGWKGVHMNDGSRRESGALRQSDDPPKGLAPGEWWEWIAIFLAIAALWPKILGWEGIIWDIAMLGALAAMVVVFIRRSRRMRKAWRDD